MNNPQIIVKNAPFKRFCMSIGAIPTSYLDSLDYYETLLWLIKYLEETIIPTVNNNGEAVSELQTLYIQLKDFVENYFANLDVQEEINNKLDVMALDGTLENLIGNVLNKINGSLTLSVAYRDCDEYISGITDETINAVKGYSQGFTTTPTSFLIIRQYGGASAGGNICYLEEISKSTLETLRIVKLELFHGNSLAYNHEEHEIYVAPSSQTSGGTTISNNSIIIINYDTLTIKNTITLPNEITNITNISSVSYDNKNKVLAVGGRENIFILDDFETINKHIVLNYSNTAPLTNITLNKTSFQNFTIYDNIIYVARFNASGITLFDLNGNVIKNYYDFDIETPINIGEIEDLSIEENGDVYISTHRASGTSNALYDIKDIIIFKSNFNYNGYKNYERSYSDIRISGVYVDSNTTNKLQLGTSTLPFKSITQAIYYSQYFENDNTLTINLVGSNKYYSYIVCNNNNNITINGNNNIIYGFELDRQTGLRFYNLKIDNSALRNINTSEYPVNNKIIRCNNIVFDGVTILNNSGSNFEYGMLINNSRNVYIKNINIQNFNNALLLQEMSEIFLATINVTNVNYYYYTTQNNLINGLSTASLNRVNPECNYYPQFNSIQFVGYTFDNTTNKLEINNKNIITSTSGRAFLLMLFNLSIDGSTFKFKNYLYRGESQSYNVINQNKTAMYDIYIATSHTAYSGIWTFDVRVIKTDIATNTLSDISDSVTMGIESNGIRLLG